MKRKIFSIVFALALVLGFVLATAAPAGAIPIPATTWYVDDSATGANNGTIMGRCLHNHWSSRHCCFWGRHHPGGGRNLP